MEEQKIYGYMRVSTREQHEDRQKHALLKAGVPENRIYMDKLSGKDFNRPQYGKLLRKLDDHSVLYIKSIDRLGRNYMDLNEQWRVITKEKKADIVVIDMPLLDTRREKNLLAPLSAISCWPCSVMWQKMNGIRSGRGRLRESLRQRPEA